MDRRRPTAALLRLAMLACLALLAPLAWNAAPARAAQPLVMAFDQDYQPFYQGGTPADPSGMRGMFIRFLAAFGERYPEFPVVRRVLSRKRIDVLLEAGEVQAFALNNAKFVAPELRSDCLFTTPLWTTSDHLLVRRARAGEITGPGDLPGRKVGTLRGYGYGEFESVLAREDVQRVEANDQVSNLRMLAAGRVDAVIISRHTTPGCLARAGLDETDFVLLEPPVVYIPLSVQVLAERRDFYEALESFVLESRANGFLLELERTAPCPGQE